MLIDRRLAAELGHETLRILDAGRYETPGGKVVAIANLVEAAVRGTCSYPPEHRLPDVAPGDRATRIEVRNETTLAAAARLTASGLRVAALNFASATNPGGGFLGGARAQEESLARSSALHACLAGNPMYDFHRRRGDPMYTDYVVYSPDVPVFRTDDGDLLERPYPCSFITSPAVNAKAVLKRDPSRGLQIGEAMRRRIARVLAVASLHGHEVLVLGAWGCGAFGNDSREVAELFHEALTGSYRGVFTEVVFAITDWSEERRFIGPFQRAFSGV